LESAAAGHLDVQKNEVWFVLFDGGDGRQAVGAFGFDLELWELGQVFAEQQPSVGFVVDEEDFHSKKMRGCSALVFDFQYFIQFPW
jgi:hypothetical protein